MRYTPPSNNNFLKSRRGTDSSILNGEFSSIADAIDTSLIKIWDLTASMVSSTGLAANGADIASGTDAIYYAVFCAPVNIHVVSVADFLTEAYVKDTADAKIEVVTEETTPVTISSRTLTATGEAVKTKHSTTPTVSAVAAGTILNLKITATGSSTGTGHAKVLMVYTID